MNVYNVFRIMNHYECRKNDTLTVTKIHPSPEMCPNLSVSAILRGPISIFVFKGFRSFPHAEKEIPRGQASMETKRPGMMMLEPQTLVLLGKSSPETIDFPIKIVGLSGFNFSKKTNPLKRELAQV